jgi:hypothetical protein
VGEHVVARFVNVRRRVMTSTSARPGYPWLIDPVDFVSSSRR